MMQKIKITHEALKKRLEKGDCKFFYKKKDGTIREARGTTRLESIPEDVRPKGGTSGSSIAYYDLDVNGWRSIAESQEISIEVVDAIGILTEDEITMMIWIHDKLEDGWISDFIGLITSATPERTAQLCSGDFINLVKTIRKYEEDSLYASDLRNKWYKIISE